MATKKKIFIIVIGTIFCMTTCQRKHSESKDVTKSNFTEIEIPVSDSLELTEVTKSIFTEIGTIASDSLELTKLVKNLLRWNETDRFWDFDVISTDDSIWTGINWDIHSKRMQQLSETNFFTKSFLEYYQNIAVYLDKELKENLEKYYVGDLPPFGNGANEWCDCQDFPEHWEKYFKIVDLKISTNSAEFKWTWGSGHFYFVRAKKEDNLWRISYLERFDIKNFRW